MFGSGTGWIWSIFTDLTGGRAPANSGERRRPAMGEEDRRSSGPARGTRWPAPANGGGAGPAEGGGGRSSRGGGGAIAGGRRMKRG